MAIVHSEVKHVEPQPLSPALLDSLVKYSALIAAATYLAGFIYFAFLLSYIHHGGSILIHPISAPVLLTHGAGQLTLFAGALTAGLMPLSFRTTRWPTGLVKVLCLALIIICWARFTYRNSWFLSAMPLAPILLSLFWIVRYRRQPSNVKYFLAASYVVIGLMTFAAANAFLAVRGQYHWNKVRLLISPDARAGARDLGIEFPSFTGGSTEHELSAPVTVLVEDDKTYLLQTDSGRLLELSKDKIWGTEWTKH